MNLRKSACALVVGLLGTLLIAAAAAPVPKLKEITLQRTACYGRCPVYTLTLRADGTAIYEGEAHVARIGTYRGKFWARDLERLSGAMQGLGSDKWKKSYASGATDQSSQIVTIVTGDGKRTIREYGHVGPDGLWALQTMIDGIGASVNGWERVKAE